MGIQGKKDNSKARHLRRVVRRKMAEERMTERAKRTPAQQLTRLDNMFGKGIGAVRERLRLNKLV